MPTERKVTHNYVTNSLPLTTQPLLTEMYSYNGSWFKLHDRNNSLPQVALLLYCEQKPLHCQHNKQKTPVLTVSAECRREKEGRREGRRRRRRRERWRKSGREWNRYKK